MALISTSSSQIQVEIIGVKMRDTSGEGYVSGWKVNKRLSQSSGPFSVYFRNNEPVPVDGIGRPHPKLVMAAARAAWNNF